MFCRVLNLSAIVCGLFLAAVPVSAQLGGGNRAARLTPTVADFAYGDHVRHVLDFYRAPSLEPTPLVLYIHGGGFTRGDKRSVNQPTLKALLAAGISVAAINYRLAGQVPLPAAHEDAQRAVQTLRAKAAEWNIDKDQVGAFGGSAGAQLCMWLAYNDDQAIPSSDDPIARESTRLAYVAPLNGQSTNDFDWWLENLPGYDELHRDPAEIFGTSEKAEQAAIAAKISVIGLVSADDPPTFMRYGMAPGDPIPDGDRAQGWKVHHVNFGLALQAKLDAVGVENVLHYPGADSAYSTAADFFISKFGKSEVRHLTGKELAEYHRKLVKLLEQNPNQTGEIYRQGVSGGVGGWSPLPESQDRNHYLSILHRGGNSWAESHDQKTDFYIMLEGSGTLLLGGEMVDAIQAEGRPGEWRSPRLENPRRIEAREGDLINIPVKTPHQWDLAEGESVTYVILKVVERDQRIRNAAPGLNSQRAE
jgi:acetyl esterase/lipase